MALQISGGATEKWVKELTCFAGMVKFFLPGRSGQNASAVYRETG